MGHQTRVRELLEIEKQMIESQNHSPGGARNLNPEPESLPLHPCDLQDDRGINSELPANPGRHGCARRYLED
jgi:hypothetical protein